MIFIYIYFRLLWWKGFSDKFICNDIGFYDILERDDEIMSDRGYQIKEELILKFCTLVIPPPGARIKSQMKKDECKKTIKVENLRIHVKRAINRPSNYHAASCR